MTDKTYDQVMTAANQASYTDNQRIRQAAVNDISDFLQQHAPDLNDKGDLGDLTNEQVDTLGAAADNLIKGMHVVYKSPLASALDPEKVAQDVAQGAKDALATAAEGATKGLGSTALKIAAAALVLLIGWAWFKSEVAK